MSDLSDPHTSPMEGRPLTLRGLGAAFWAQIGVTWAMTIIEVGLLALVPLLIGQAIDGLLSSDLAAFTYLGGVLAALILLGTLRRVYDTRAYGSMRVELGKTLARRSIHLPVSMLNARLSMVRELVDFLESDAPVAMTALIRTVATLVILWSFHSTLALTALGAFAGVLALYYFFHGRFFHLNRALNQLHEQQVGVLESRSLSALASHLQKLRKGEVRLSDTEGIVYGLVFVVLLAFVMFNLWFATRAIEVTPGKVFSIITYSWDFVESASVLPVTLQSLSRLNEITTRINATGEDGT